MAALEANGGLVEPEWARAAVRKATTAPPAMAATAQALQTIQDAIARAGLPLLEF